MNKHIEKIHENNAKIRTNEAYIQENKQAIESLKQGYVPVQVVLDTAERYCKIVHRLTGVICLILIALFICNAIWLYAWKQIDFGNVTITQGGEVNHVGGGE